MLAHCKINCKMSSYKYDFTTLSWGKTYLFMIVIQVTLKNILKDISSRGLSNSKQHLLRGIFILVIDCAGKYYSINVIRSQEELVEIALEYWVISVAPTRGIRELSFHNSSYRLWQYECFITMWTLYWTWLHVLLLILHHLILNWIYCTNIS